MKHLKNISFVLDVFIDYIASPGYALTFASTTRKHIWYGTLKQWDGLWSMDYGLAFLTPQLYAHDYFIKYLWSLKALPKSPWLLSMW